MLVVNGAYRGHKAILETLDTSNFCATIRIDQVSLYYPLYVMNSEVINNHDFNYCKMISLSLYRGQSEEDLWIKFPMRTFQNCIHSTCR